MLVLEVAQVWGGVQVGFAGWVGQLRMVKSVYSSWDVQVGVCRSGVVNSWLPSFDGVSLHTTSR
jgi:hypothetical protein